MQGINRNRHVHLMDALLQLEILISNSGSKDASCIDKANAYQQQLTTMFAEYEQRLRELSIQIGEYEDLFSEIKTSFLGGKLKELKKKTSKDQPVFRLLTENIKLVYGT